MKLKERRRKREERREKREKASLDRAWEEAHAIPAAVPIEKLRQMTGSPNVHDRLMSLILVRRQIGDGVAPREFFDFALGLIGDRDSNCRWQAVIVIGESIDTDPEAVWNVVAKYGNSTDDDMRTAIGCCLLEHLFDDHFDAYFPRVQDEIRRGRHRLVDTLKMCWFDDCSGPNYQLAQRFVDEARRGEYG